MLNQLRHRLVFTTCALVIGVTALFCLGLYLSFEVAEEKLFESHLGRDVASLLALYAHDPSLVDVPNSNFKVYVAPNGAIDGLPEHIARLGADDDELILDGREFEVQIYQLGTTKYYFLFDESPFESFENALFMTMSVLIISIVALAAWLSVALARRVIQPLTRLAHEVATLDEHAEPTITLPRDSSQNDEIALLATAIDGYHRRINVLLRREREFSADVSHELRTPLMGVQGAAELLERRALEHPELAELSNRIRRGCLHMTTLTEALLYLARDPSMFQDMLEPVSMASVVAGQVAAVSDVTRAKGILVNVEKNGEPATVETIPAVANIVIGNILKNAVKYTNRDVISVYLTPHEVVIQDYGPGIDESVQDTLFDRFNRGENRNSDGTGIGLALVRRFCDQYGWSINFKSEVDKGTRIAVVF